MQGPESLFPPEEQVPGAQLRPQLFALPGQPGGLANPADAEAAWPRQAAEEDDEEVETPDDGEEHAAPPDLGRLAETVDYTVRLSEAARRRLGTRICREIERYEAAVQSRKELLQEWRRDYEMVPSAGPEPWDHASSLRAPFARVAADQHATRLNSQIVQADPPFSARARTPEAVERAPAIEEALAAILEEANWKDVAREVHREITAGAACLVCVTYARKTARVPRLKVNFDEKAFAQRVRSGTPVDAAFRGAVESRRDGTPRVRLEFEETVTYDGVKLSCVPWEDLIVLPVNATDPEQIWGIGERVRLRGFDLREGEREGRYRKEAVEDLLRSPGDSPDADDVEDTEEFSAVDLDGGAYEDSLYREYDCAELCWYDDLDGDGFQEWYLITVHLPTGKVLRAQYSPYEHGRPYYVLFNYLPRSRQLFGQGVIELLATTQDGATATINNFNDLVSLLVAMAGSFFVDEDSGIEPERFVFAPGRPVKCQDPQRTILPMPVAQNIPIALQACLQALDMYKTWADLLTATSNPVVGRETAGQHTLGELRMVVGNAMAVFEDKAAGVALTWAKVWDLVRWTVAQYAEHGQVRYRKSARPGEAPEFKAVDAELLKAEIDLSPAGLAEWADAQARVARNMLVNGLLLQDPQLATVPEVKLTLLEQTLRDVKHPRAERLLEIIRQALAQQQQMQQQMQQMQALMQAASGAGPDGLTTEPRRHGEGHGERDGEERVGAG